MDSAGTASFRLSVEACSGIASQVLLQVSSVPCISLPSFFFFFFLFFLGLYTRDGLLDLQTALLMPFNASICVSWELVRRMAIVLRRLSARSPVGRII